MFDEQILLIIIVVT